MMSARIKICCISSIEEAWMAIRCGASAIGLVSAMPSGPGIISEELIAEIAAQIPPAVATFMLTSARDPRQIIEQIQRCRTNTVQICDRVNVPIFLAGGLNPKNIALAIEQVEPFGLDVCSGVRTNGKLDEDKLKRFFAQLNTIGIMMRSPQN